MSRRNSFSASVPRAQPVTVASRPTVRLIEIGDPKPLRIEPCRHEQCEVEGVHPAHGEDFGESPDGKPVGSGRRPPSQQLTADERLERRRARRAAKIEKLKQQSPGRWR